MAEYADVVVATGRFQTLHIGSLLYLEAAKSLSSRKGTSLYILTGPCNSELQKHAQRRDASGFRRPLLFEERSLLISIILGISARNVLAQASSPHHGDPDLSTWMKCFFKPLVERGIVSDQKLACKDASPIEIAVVIKNSDFKIYRPGDSVRHYTDYLRDEYRNVVITDLADQVGKDKTLFLEGAGDLARRVRDRAKFLPPTMVGAEILLSEGYSLTDAPSTNLLTEIFSRFGNAPRSYEEISNAVDLASGRKGAR
jgi:hypothetical protein